MRSEHDGDVLVVFLTETEIRDEMEIQRIGDELSELVKEAKKLVLDFDAVQFMSSAMIGKLVTLNKDAKARDIEFTMRNVGPTILEIFRITRLDRVFPLENDGQEESA